MMMNMCDPFFHMNNCDKIIAVYEVTHKDPYNQKLVQTFLP